MAKEEISAMRDLGAEQRAMLERAWAEIDLNQLRELLAAMVNIPSPTGEERRLAEFAASYMAESGLDAISQPIDLAQANAIGRIRGIGGGPALLLYAPLDTDFTGVAEEDCPGVGPSLPPELQPRAVTSGDTVLGLGAVNPKGFASCVIAAAEAVKKSGLELRGDVIVGLGAGGMPTNRRPLGGSPRMNAGQGTGCSFMLEQGIRGDFAIIAKPGWAVAWEEVGLCWFKVVAKGTLGYVGTRHLGRYDNAVMHAATAIRELEEWFSEYAKRHRSELINPQGIVGAIEGGWSYKPSFIPASCAFYVDLRVTPLTDPMTAKREFEAALAAIMGRNPEIRLECEMILSIPGSHTDPGNWIIGSCVRAWEALEGRDHVPLTNTSGATDANILRNRGIPTARIGMPRATSGPTISPRAASLSSMERLVKCLIYSIIDTCGRGCGEVGV